MKTIHQRFEEIAERNPGLSSYACFAQAITGRGIGAKEIRKAFTALVDAEEYDEGDREAILRGLGEISEK